MLIILCTLCTSIWTLVSLFCVFIGSPYKSTWIYLQILLISILAHIICSRLRDKQIFLINFILWVVHVLLVAYLIFFTIKVKGSKRWLHIANISYQPSEVLKLSSIVIFSHIVAKKKFFLAIISQVVPIVLFVQQPDIGSVFILLLSMLTVLIFHGIKKRILLIFILLTSIFSVLGIHYFPHALRRVKVFRKNPGQDYEKYSYQNRKSIEAIVSGGWTGSGLGQGRVKYLIPDGYSDFIFSIIAEELGFITCLVLVISYLSLVLTCLYYGNLSAPGLALVGLGSILSTQAWIHMATCVWLIPSKGTTLPMISHGGTSLLATHINMGLILAAFRAIKKNRVIT